MAVYIGIDPGFDGGIAIIREGGEPVLVFKTPATSSVPREYLEAQMASLLIPLAEERAVAAIEEQRAMPKQGATSMFKIGVGYGLWRGLLSAYSIPYDIVRPRDWKRAVGLPAGADKAASVALASRLFPRLSDQFVGPRGGLKDGLAEAVLIAEYRRRIS